MLCVLSWECNVQLVVGLIGTGLLAYAWACFVVDVADLLIHGRDLGG